MLVGIILTHVSEKSLVKMASQLDSIDAQASQADNSSQFNEKQWNLKGGTTMTIGNYYKKKPDDKFRTLDLVFRFQNDPKPKIVGMLYENIFFKYMK